MKRKQECARRWRRNWAGRGTETMNLVEAIDSDPTPRLKFPSTEQQLKCLLKLRPNNAFYLSIESQLLTKRLSQKQTDIINREYAYKVVRVEKRKTNDKR